MTDQPKEVLFGTLGGNDDVGAPMEVTSLCMACGAEGTTRILLTRIPHFREVILMAFECPACGARNNEVQSGAPVNEKGFKASLSVKNLKDLSRQVVKAETASVTLDELALEIPAATQRGVLSTVEGLVNGALDGLAQEQEYRRVRLFVVQDHIHIHLIHRVLQTNHPELYEKIEGILATLRSYLTGTDPFTLTLDDPAGNSYIESLCAPNPDPQITAKSYIRTNEQDIALGLVADGEEGTAQEEAKQIGDTGLTTDDLAYKEEVHTFPGNCSRCHAPSDTKMHMLGELIFMICNTSDALIKVHWTQKSHTLKTLLSWRLPVTLVGTSQMRLKAVEPFLKKDGEFR